MLAPVAPKFSKYVECLHPFILFVVVIFSRRILEYQADLECPNIPNIKNNKCLSDTLFGGYVIFGHRRYERNTELWSRIHEVIEGVTMVSSGAPICYWPPCSQFPRRVQTSYFISVWWFRDLCLWFLSQGHIHWYHSCFWAGCSWA